MPLPASGGSSISSSAGAIDASATPRSSLRASAVAVGTRRPMARSPVMFWPPAGMTPLARAHPPWKSAKLVTPPPMSTSRQPASRSASLRTASAAASGSKTTLISSYPAFSITFVKCSIGCRSPVTMWSSAPSRAADIPAGSAIPV